MARPQKKIDPKLVASLASIFCSMEEIATIVGCSVDTLERRFAGVIKEAKETGKSSLRRAQYESAVKKKNVIAQIWLGKVILGQREQKADPPSGMQAIHKQGLAFFDKPAATVTRLQPRAAGVPERKPKSGTGSR